VRKHGQLWFYVWPLESSFGAAPRCALRHLSALKVHKVGCGSEGGA
jgi:hypothetical protein